MTNVSAVEKMAELMQQMEENSPRVAMLQYFLTQVAEKVEEAEKRNAELEARCAALDALFADEEVPERAMLAAYNLLRGAVVTPVTHAFLAEVRAQGVEMFARHCQMRHGEMMKSEPNEANSNEAITAIRRAGEFALFFAAQLRKGAQ